MIHLQIQSLKVTTPTIVLATVTSVFYSNFSGNEQSLKIYLYHDKNKDAELANQQQLDFFFSFETVCSTSTTHGRVQAWVRVHDYHMYLILPIVGYPRNLHCVAKST